MAAYKDINGVLTKTQTTGFEAILTAIINRYEDYREIIEKNEPYARAMVLEQIALDNDVYMPAKTGKLATDVEPSIYPVASLTYKAQSEAGIYYASYAMNPNTATGVSKNYTKTIHPQAQGYPLEASADKNAVKWAEMYAHYLLRGVI